MNKKQFPVALSLKLLAVFVTIFFLGSFVFSPKDSKKKMVVPYPTVSEATTVAADEEFVTDNQSDDEVAFKRMVAIASLISSLVICEVQYRNISHNLIRRMVLVISMGVVGYLCFKVVSQTNSGNVFDYKDFETFYFMSSIALTLVSFIICWHSEIKTSENVLEQKSFPRSFLCSIVFFACYFLPLFGVAYYKNNQVNLRTNIYSMAGILLAIYGANQLLDFYEIIEPVVAICAMIGIVWVFQFQGFLEQGFLTIVNQEGDKVVAFFKKPFWSFILRPCYYGGFFINCCIAGASWKSTKQLMFGVFLLREVLPALLSFKWKNLHFPTQMPFMIALYWGIGRCLVHWAENNERQDKAFAQLLNSIGLITLWGVLIYGWVIWCEGSSHSPGWKTALLSGIFGGTMVHMMVNPDASPLSIIFFKSIVLSLVGAAVIVWGHSLFEAFCTFWRPYVSNKYLSGPTNWLQRNFLWVVIVISGWRLFVGGSYCGGTYRLNDWSKKVLCYYVALVGGLLLGTLEWHPRRWIYGQPPKHAEAHVVFSSVSTNNFCSGLKAQFIVTLFAVPIFVKVVEGLTFFESIIGCLLGLWKGSYSGTLNLGLMMLVATYLIAVYGRSIVGWLCEKFPKAKEKRSAINMIVIGVGALIMSIGPAGLVASHLSRG